MRPRRVLETAVYADDLDVAERFYTEVLGLEVHSRNPGRSVFFECGGTMLLVFDPAVTIRPGGTDARGPDVPPHGTSGPGHMAFAVTVTELEAWRGRLSSCGVDIEQEVQWPGGGESLYFRDPAGNSIELAVATIWGIDEPD